MTGRDISRRAWLLGSAGLLAGCETLDSIFGERRVKIVGERKPGDEIAVTILRGGRETVLRVRLGSE